MIAPEIFLVRRVASKVCLRRVQTRHAFVRSLANSVTHERAQCQSRDYVATAKARSNGLPDHALTVKCRLPNSQTKFKTHRSGRVRRKH